MFCIMDRRSFTYEEFINTQTKFQKRQADFLAIRSREIQGAIDDIVTLVQSFPRDNPEIQILGEDVEKFYHHYSTLTYKVKKKCFIFL